MFSLLIVILILVHLGALLAVAGVAKTADLAGFVAQLSAHDLMRPKLVRAVALSVPVSEVWVGIWLLSGVTPRLALFSASGLFGVFLVYRVLMRHAAIEAPCGCFGRGHDVGKGELPESIALVINMGLGLFAAFVLSNSALDIYPFYVTIAVCGFAVFGLLAMFLAVNRRIVTHSQSLNWAFSVKREASSLGTPT